MTHMNFDHMHLSPHPTLPVTVFSSFKAPGGGGVTFITSFMVEPTTIIFTPFVTCNSLNVLLPSLTSPAGDRRTNKQTKQNVSFCQLPF